MNISFSIQSSRKTILKINIVCQWVNILFPYFIDCGIRINDYYIADSLSLSYLFFKKNYPLDIHSWIAMYYVIFLINFILCLMFYTSEQGEIRSMLAITIATTCLFHHLIFAWWLGIFIQFPKCLLNFDHLSWH